MEDQELARKIALRIKEAGGRAYFVGGYVRDRLLQKESGDIDIEVYSLLKEELHACLKEFGEVLEKGCFFGVFGLAHSHLDVALPRSEKKTGAGHRDFMIDTDPFLSVEDASRRRDFTINAMLEDILTGEIIDPHGGQRDLKRGVICHIEDDTFGEDPLRVLRAARFRATLGFDIDPSTKELCRHMDLSSLSKERIKEEVEKALLAPYPQLFFESLKEMNQLSFYFKELEDLIDLPQNIKYHKEDVFTHTMMVLEKGSHYKDQATNPPYFLYACLCHDLGKATTTFLKEGIAHAYGHEKESVFLAKKLLGRFSEEKALLRYVCELSGDHMLPLQAYLHPKKEKILKMLDRSGNPKDLLLLSYCDHKGRIDEKREEQDDYALWLKEAYELYQDFCLKEHISGKDLIAMGYAPNQNFSHILKRARELEYQYEKEEVLFKIKKEFPCDH